MRICLFIDGLDEFDGSEDEKEEVNDMLQSLATCNSTKICLSSRPLNIYCDTFEGVPQIRLEDLTQSDIQLFVGDKMEANKYF